MDLTRTLLASLFLAACGSVENGATTPADPAPPSPPVAVDRATTIRATASDSTVAAGPFPEGHTPTPSAEPTSFLIQPSATGFEVIGEGAGSGPTAPAPIADAEVAKLVELARALQPQLCATSPSPHNDPRVFFDGAVTIDMFGGIAMGSSCTAGAEACDACGKAFDQLREAVVAAAKAALAAPHTAAP
jgi:hypothetical protein